MVAPSLRFGMDWVVWVRCSDLLEVLCVLSTHLLNSEYPRAPHRVPVVITPPINREATCA